MKKIGKKLSDARKKVNSEKRYALTDAAALLKEVSYTKFDGTVEVAMNLGVDPRHADQNVRGAVVLPHGLGKKVRVLVFAKGEKIKEAEEAGADYVGGEDIAQKILGGWLDFEAAVATPDMMGVVGRLGKILAPRGLMPKAGIIQAPVGKTSFSAPAIEENLKTFVEAILKAKPSAAKGTYVKSAYVSATMSPSIRLDTTEMK